MLKDAAFRRTTALMGPYVYYRGLIELSNICTANCRYCGIPQRPTTTSSATQ